MPYKIQLVAKDTSSNDRAIVLVVNPSTKKADVFIDASASGTADVDVTAGTVTFGEHATDRLTRSGLDAATVTGTASYEVWVETRAREAFDAAAPLGRPHAWASMHGAAMHYASLATTGSEEERARARRVQARIVELGEAFK